MVYDTRVFDLLHETLVSLYDEHAVAVKLIGITAIECQQSAPSDQSETQAGHQD